MEPISMPNGFSHREAPARLLAQPLCGVSDAPTTVEPNLLGVLAEIPVQSGDAGEHELRLIADRLERHRRVLQSHLIDLHATCEELLKDASQCVSKSSFVNNLVKPHRSHHTQIHTSAVSETECSIDEPPNFTIASRAPKMMAAESNEPKVSVTRVSFDDVMLSCKDPSSGQEGDSPRRQISEAPESSTGSAASHAAGEAHCDEHFEEEFQELKKKTQLTKGEIRDLIHKTKGAVVGDSRHELLSQAPATKEYTIFWFALLIITSSVFEIFCGFVIIANAITIGYDSDTAMKNPSAPVDGRTKALETFFAIFYTFELILRILAWREKFFKVKDRYWHIFDTFLVIAALYEMIIVMLPTDSDHMNFTFARLIRMMKMVKMFRVVRVTKMFRELRLLLSAVQGSISTMLWAIVLIVLTTYLFGLVFVQACATHLGLQSGDGDVSESDRADMSQYWGSVSQAMLSLYWASTGGESWRYVARPLRRIGTAGEYYGLFLVYISFFMLVIVNTLTSLFLEATLRNAETDGFQAIQEEIAKKDQAMQAFEVLFKSMDEDDSGDISLDEFLTHLSDPLMQAFASQVDLDIQDVASFFNILSGEGEWAVNLETFVVGCMKLKGTAKSMDMMALHAMVAKLLALQTGHHERMHEVCKHLGVQSSKRRRKSVAGFSLSETDASQTSS